MRAVDPPPPGFYAPDLYAARWLWIGVGVLALVVLWYVFGIHHITRVEDWPIMPADIVSFWLKPFGFFDQNPSIDVAPSEKAGAEAHCHSGIDYQHHLHH